jgi:ribulose-phosphate 3-epimerase
MSDASRNFEIVPAILTDDAAELDRLLAMLKSAGASRVHLDIIDGSLIEGRTVLGYRELADRDVGMALDVHLMVDRPDEHLVGWEQVPNISRVIAHVEAHADPKQIAADCRKKDRQWWGAINPDSPLNWLEFSGFVGCMYGATFMTVMPGAQGRPFRDDVLGRMRTWKRQHPHMPLMVDGGVSPDTAPCCATAGASILVAGSFVVRADDPKAALREIADSVRSA